MANPTTNYGFVLPTSTDLVTDLPADFDVALQGVDTRLKALNPSTTLGDTNYASATANTNTRLAIGSTGQVLTVAGGVPTWATPATSTSGLTFISKVDFSASTTVNINSVFSSTYTNYRIIGSHSNSTTTQGDINMRLRASGTDTTTGYVVQRFYANGTGSGFGYNTTGTDEWFIGNGQRTGSGLASWTVDLMNPNAATSTQLANSISSYYDSSSGIPGFDLMTGIQTGTTQFDGFTMTFSQITTGTFFIYGYQKA